MITIITLVMALIKQNCQEGQKVSLNINKTPAKLNGLALGLEA
jgi:hypothetical protein